MNKEERRMRYLNNKIAALDDVERIDMEVDRRKGINITQMGKRNFRAFDTRIERICKFKGRSTRMPSANSITAKIEQYG